MRREYTLLGPVPAWQAPTPCGLGQGHGQCRQFTPERPGPAVRPAGPGRYRRAAAWYNLGLTRAWLGDNPAALEALQRYLELDPSDEQAASAGALMEVLRFGVGMAEQSDYQEWSFGFRCAPTHSRSWIC